jgi:hypothetical protein
LALSFVGKSTANAGLLQDGKFMSARAVFPPIVTSSWLALCGASSQQLNLMRDQISGEPSN